MDTDKRRRTTRRAPRPPAPRRGGGESMTPFEEVRNVERLVGSHGLRSLPWHAIFAAQLRAGTASPEIVEAARVAKEQWERANVPTVAPARAVSTPSTPRDGVASDAPAPGPASRGSFHQTRSFRRTK